MDPLWIKVIKVTGSVGVIGLLFSILFKQLFQNEIITLFGSDRMFYILLSIISILGIALIIAILKRDKLDESSPKVIYKDNSKHEGDNKF